MCGIFGFVSADVAGPDVEWLRAIAVETETRGRHAFGLVWLDQDGHLHTFKRPGAATNDLGDLDRVEGAVIVAGHCRWATHGDPYDNANNHPHRAGQGWIVHNGAVRNYLQLASDYRIRRQTDCDTEVYAALLAKMVGPLYTRAARAASVVDGPLAVLGVWRAPGRLLVAKRGSPLWSVDANQGTYLASLPGELGLGARPVREGWACVIGPGRRHHEAMAYEDAV